MAYTRIPSQQIVYSLVEEERGKDAGRMQTVFLRVSFLLKTFECRGPHNAGIKLAGNFTGSLL